MHLEKETFNTYLPKLFGKLTNPGRVMELTTLKTIEKDYLFSWYVKNKSLQDNTKPALKIIIRKTHVKIYTL
jgi:hypothetical protein